MRMYRVLILFVLALVVSACSAPKIRLFPGPRDPLQEFTLEGKAKEKVLVIPIRGNISDAPRETTFRTLGLHLESYLDPYSRFKAALEFSPEARTVMTASGPTRIWVGS